MMLPWNNRLEWHMLWHLLCIVLLFSSETCGQCEFPGQFQGSHVFSKTYSQVTVGPSNMSGIKLLDSPILETAVGTDYECVANSGNLYVVRSVGGRREAGESEDRHVYFCMDLTVLSSTKSTFVQATQTGPGSKPVHCKYLTPSAVGSDPVTSVCDLPPSSYSPGMFSLFLKLGEETSWSQNCPSSILGEFTNQNPTCPVTSDACADQKSLSLTNTSSCPALPFFTSTGQVTCVNEYTSGSVSFIHLYNTDTSIDNTNTFLFTCLALETVGGNVLISQNPGDCVANQSPEIVTTNGILAFNFTQPDTSKLCPITTTPTTSLGTTTATPGLSTAASVGLALGLLALLALVALLFLFLCLRRRRKKKMEAESRRIEERRERRRIRRERRLKRMREGLPPDDDGNDSSDSGYSGRSTSTLVKEEEEEEGEEGVAGRGEEVDERRGEELKTPRMRRIYDLDGNLLYEEEIPDPSESAEETDTDEGRRKKKRVRKTRRYTRDRTLQDGTVVQELVESDYWRSDSEGSTVSITGSVTEQIDQAKLRREKDRRDIMDRSTGSTVPTLVTRPRAERQESPERSSFLPRIFHKLARGKRKISDEGDPVREIPDSDKFLPQYHVKKEAEHRLEDEGFWEDPKVKKTALEIFDFDTLDPQLEEPVSHQHRHIIPSPASSDILSGDEMDKQGDKNEEVKQPRRGILSSGRPRRPKSTRLPTIERPSGFISGSHDDTCDELSSSLDSRKKEQSEILARVSRLLTERLFPSEEEDSQPGRVMRVQERPSSAQSTSRGRSRKSSTSSYPHPHKPDEMSTDDGGVFYTSQSLELPPLASRRYTPRGRGGIASGRASLLRYGLRHDRSLVSRLIKAPRPPREAWAEPDNEPDTESGMRKWSLQSKTQGESENGERERGSRGSADTRKYLDMDEARLRRLLEELYKDKKYMDALLSAEAASRRDEVRVLAEYGRNYLLQMADYWEVKGPLPPRPSTTALGFKMERARTAQARRAQTAALPEVHRSNTMIN